jgi:pentatricopeptide repeat protein
MKALTDTARALSLTKEAPPHRPTGRPHDKGFGRRARARRYCSLVTGVKRRTQQPCLDRAWPLVRLVEPDAVTFSSVIHGLCEIGRMRQAVQVREMMADRGVQV